MMNIQFVDNAHGVIALLTPPLLLPFPWKENITNSFTFLWKLDEPTDRIDNASSESCMPTSGDVTLHTDITLTSQHFLAGKSLRGWSGSSYVIAMHVVYTTLVASPMP